MRSRRRGGLVGVMLSVSALAAGAATYAAIDPGVTGAPRSVPALAEPGTALGPIRPDVSLLHGAPMAGAAPAPFGREAPLSSRLAAPPAPAAFTVASLPPTPVALVPPDSGPAPEAGPVTNGDGDLVAPLP
ncbi:MAG: hypothetical protein ACK4M0_11160, partial [Phreatobacter sp.]